MPGAAGRAPFIPRPGDEELAAGCSFVVSQVEQLQMHNAMLEILARSVDVPLAFQSLAQRIARLVPCDRVGLALLTDAGDEFQTYTARFQDLKTREELEDLGMLHRLERIAAPRERAVIGHQHARRARGADRGASRVGIDLHLSQPLLPVGPADGRGAHRVRHDGAGLPPGRGDPAVGAVAHQVPGRIEPSRDFGAPAGG